MKKSKIFLKKEGSDKLNVLEESEWHEEKSLQKLLATFPDLMPGDQIGIEEPLRWLLVSREMSVPNREDVRGPFSLDHLFLDQDGIPTFVECKRNVNNESRRKIVAQLLDYAANGTRYWSMDFIKEEASKTNESQDIDFQNRVYHFLEEDKDDITNDDIVEEVEKYWEKVEKNLQEHKVRLIFVLDKVPEELKRLVEFLNEEMINVEVLAIEIKRYKYAEDFDQSILVPNVIGATAKAKELKNKSRGKSKINKNEFYLGCDDINREFFEEIFEIIKKEDNIHYRMGTVGFSVGIINDENEYKKFFYGFPPEHSSYNNNYQIKSLDFINEDDAQKELERKLSEYTVLNDGFNASINESNKDKLIEIFNFLVEELKNLLAKKVVD